VDDRHCFTSGFCCSSSLFFIFLGDVVSYIFFANRTCNTRVTMVTVFYGGIWHDPVIFPVIGPPPCGAGAPPFPLVSSLPVFCSFLLFPFLVGFNYFLLLSLPFLSTRIVPLRFQARGRRKRSNLGLVCCV